MIYNLIRVMIANDTLTVREYLTTVLSHEPDMKIVCSVGSGALAVEQALMLKPDVVLIDIEMETPWAGIDAIRTLAAKAPKIRSIVYTHLTNDEAIFAAFEAGAVDYLLKNSSATQTLEAIRAAAQDKTTIRPEIAELIREEFRALRSERATLVNTLKNVYKLTPTELELLKLFAEGKTPGQIIALRHIEASTFRTHVGNVLKKFKASSVRDVVFQLKHLGVFEIFFSENHKIS
ncbi:MAG: response regulator [Bacteroidota bacterium]